MNALLALLLILFVLSLMLMLRWSSPLAGLATRALTEFLKNVNVTRPIYARVAKDNLGSRRVLEKCGFGFISESNGFANARNAEIDELLLERK